MKKFKKMFAIALAMVMVLAMNVSVFAATGDHLTTAESKIEATNVKAGDSVEYYQLVEWKDGNWALTTLGGQCGVTLENLIDGITEAEATTIADAMVGKSKTGDMDVNATTTTTFEKTGVAAGLYYLKAIPADSNKDTVYNPAFVSADYTEGGNTVSFSSAFENSTVLKKSNVPFDKEVTGNDQFIDTKPGDVIPYKITTTIPSYGTTFTNPQFKITDTLSTGLTLTGDVSVKVGDAAAFTTSNADVATIEKSDSGFTVTFAKAYLTGLNGAQPTVEITYSATVGEVTDNVTYMDNKAKLTYSNSPTTTKDQDDITRHYTFSIDGNLLGSSNNQTDELIKVACDANGDPIYSTTTTYYGSDVNPLDGASFTLTPVSPTTGTAKTVSSADGGHIQFLGLDAGEYTLVENSAPAGYVKDSKTYTVKIIPHYNTTTPDLLDSYDVEFWCDGTKLSTSAFEMNNQGEVVATTSSQDTDNMQQIGNTPGSELPSTGGMGTTILYVIGTLLVLGAGVLLVTRRRMSAQ